MERPAAAAASPWKHYPWLLGILLAPLYFGSVNPDGQAVIAALFAISLLLLAPDIGGQGGCRPVCTPLWRWLAAVCLVLPLIPLPVALMEFLSPQRVALERNFPIEPGVAPDWLPLSISPANTVQRLWEMGLIITAFCLARYAAAYARFYRSFVLLIGVGLLLLAASDVWFRLDGQRKILGVWPNTAGHAAGTFANRNHFANWLYVGGVFVFGWILRQRWPLQSARPRALPVEQRSKGDAFFLMGVTLFSLFMAVISGSRGGLMAFFAGLVVWVILLAQRSRRRSRWLVLGPAALATFLLLLAASDYLLGRLAESQSNSLFKFAIWRDALGIVTKFPLFGSGWGTFVTAFNHYKTFGGEFSFLHAENEFVQLLVESGLFGALVFGAFGYRLFATAVGFAWRERHAEPELVFGAVAAVVAFLAHACFEFVFQITATALLAAALLGMVVGCRDQTFRPMVLPPPTKRRMLMNLSWAAALILAAGLQGVALVQSQRALRATSASAAAEQLIQSLRLWPWDAHRQIALTRAQVRLLASPASIALGQPDKQPAPIRQRLNRALSRDPFNWELRLERAWLDLAYSTNLARARAEAWAVVNLNPLQPQIPLRFARQFVASDPGWAMEFLRAPALKEDQYLREILRVAWTIEGNTSALWSLTPDTVNGLQTLGDFAVEQEWMPLAAQAYQRLANRVDTLRLAENFLRARRPDLALASLPQPPASAAAKWLLSRACWQAGKYPEAIHHAESLWLESRYRKQIVTPVNSPMGLDALRKEAAAQPRNLALARQLAEKIYSQPVAERDLPRLLSLARDFPKELRMTWLVFQTELELHQFQEAAGTALQLAGRVTALE